MKIVHRTKTSYDMINNIKSDYCFTKSTTNRNLNTCMNHSTIKEHFPLPCTFKKQNVQEITYYSSFILHKFKLHFMENVSL